MLQAQRSVLRDATEAAHAAAGRLVGEPRYERLLERLVAEARERLDANGDVRADPCCGGRRGGSRGQPPAVDYSLRAQVDRCLEALAGELERLWR